MKLIDLKRLLELGDQSKIVYNGFRGARTTRQDWNALEMIKRSEEITIGMMRDCVADSIDTTFEGCFIWADSFEPNEYTSVYFDGIELDLGTVLDWLQK